MILAEATDNYYDISVQPIQSSKGTITGSMEDYTDIIYSYTIDSDFPIEIYNIEDEELTVSTYRIIEESLREEWEEEDDEHWRSFLKE